MKNRTYLMAKIVPQIQYVQAVKDALLSLIEPTSQETGCHCFRLHEDRETRAAFYLYEIFEDDEALQIHYARPMVKDVFKNYEEWLAEPVHVTKMEYLAG